VELSKSATLDEAMDLACSYEHLATASVPRHPTRSGTAASTVPAAPTESLASAASIGSKPFKRLTPTEMNMLEAKVLVSTVTRSSLQGIAASSSSLSTSFLTMMNKLTSQTRICHSHPAFQLGGKLSDEGGRDIT
jgi:hypothetical protein